MFDWISNTDSSWWADLATMPARARKSKAAEKFKQTDTGAITRGILLQKLVRSAAAGEIITKNDIDWLIKSRHEWAQVCRFNYSTVERRLEDLRKLKFVNVSHESEPNGRPQVLAVQLNWEMINKKAAELRAA